MAGLHVKVLIRPKTGKQKLARSSDACYISLQGEKAAWVPASDGSTSNAFNAAAIIPLVLGPGSFRTLHVRHAVIPYRSGHPRPVSSHLGSCPHVAKAGVCRRRSAASTTKVVCQATELLSRGRPRMRVRRTIKMRAKPVFLMFRGQLAADLLCGAVPAGAALQLHLVVGAGARVVLAQESAVDRTIDLVSASRIVALRITGLDFLRWRTTSLEVQATPVPLVQVHLMHGVGAVEGNTPQPFVEAAPVLLVL
mmetsp:Transcript_32275/g.74558  ORF Transcript_32275/g.74558 Transcript_32275/m.74558 type:complete len:252 (-) Transcript_32275:605-1360(-)